MSEIEEQMNKVDHLDRKQGVWKRTSGSLAVTSEGYYVDGKRHGLFTFRRLYGGDKTIMSGCGSYVNGVAQGLWTLAYKNGEVANVRFHHNGLIEGEYIDIKYEY